MNGMELQRYEDGERPSDAQALALADFEDTRALADVASCIRDQGFLNLVTFSKKVFIPLTHLCRDVCHYCTFAQTPSKIEVPYMDLDAVLTVARNGAALGCKEALFTLGEKPELRYRAAREWLAGHGYETTLEYLHDAALAVFEETGLLPHLNPGNMTPEEMAVLRGVSPSMGIMLESASERLTEKGMPHYGSPDKVPAVRLQTLEDAGRRENSLYHRHFDRHRRDATCERIESLLAIRARAGAARPHPGNHRPELPRQAGNQDARRRRNRTSNELLWTIAMARLDFRPGHERPGTAQPEPRRAAANCRCRASTTGAASRP